MIQTAASVLKDKRYFIFDLDGTLINSRKNQLEGIWYVVKNVCPTKTINYQLILDAFDQYNELTREARYQTYMTLGLSCCEEGCRDIDLFYWIGAGKVFNWLDGAEETLIKLKEIGKKLSIVTNGGNVQHRKLNLMKDKLIPEFIEFDYIEVTGDYGIEKYKPNPHCLERVIKQYGVDRSECIYIGNSIHQDGEMAKNAGVDFILYDPHEVYYDYQEYKIFDLRELI